MIYMVHEEMKKWKKWRNEEKRTLPKENETWREGGFPDNQRNTKIREQHIIAIKTETFLSPKENLQISMDEHIIKQINEDSKYVVAHQSSCKWK